MSLFPAPRAILFDLDGTLADTAPDLAAAINLLRTVRGLEPTPYEVLRPQASHGARGMIGVSFGLTPQDEGFSELRDGFFSNYEAAMAVHSVLFDGIHELLAGIADAGLRWGIVTNKPARFTDPLVPQIGLAPEECWYVGDDLRDIQAGRAAGMRTVACQWGYCGPVEPAAWGADHLLASPAELLALIRATVPSPTPLAA
jgi:phosphoglycolate phosphatase